MFGIDPSFFSSLLQVILIDLVLAGDNAVVIGLAAAGLAADLRRKPILIGIIAATVLRICFALVTTQLLSLGGGLLIAGGVLLLYVCWKMNRELSVSHEAEEEATEALAGADLNAVGTGPARRRARPCGRRSPRSLSPTFQCRWTMCWPLPGGAASL